MNDCRKAGIVEACKYAHWSQHTFHLTDKGNLIFVISSFVLAVLIVLFLLWCFKCAKLLFALNTFLDRSPRGKMPHNLRTYLSVSILREDLKELLQ